MPTPPPSVAMSFVAMVTEPCKSVLSREASVLFLFCFLPFALSIVKKTVFAAAALQLYDWRRSSPCLVLLQRLEGALVATAGGEAVG